MQACRHAGRIVWIHGSMHLCMQAGLHARTHTCQSARKYTPHMPKHAPPRTGANHRPYTATHSNATPHTAMHHHTMLHRATSCHAAPCYVMPRHAMPTRRHAAPHQDMAAQCTTKHRTASHCLAPTCTAQFWTAIMCVPPSDTCTTLSSPTTSILVCAALRTNSSA